MKITALETMRLEAFPNLLWVRIHTDAGLYGLGETYFGAAAVEAHLHEFVQQKLLGRNPLEIEAIWMDLNNFYLGFCSTGVEGRANSAVDFDDLNLFLNNADELALSLLESGITAMKIWPFDEYIEGGFITVSDAPGLGLDLLPDLFKREDLILRQSNL